MRTLRIVVDLIRPGRLEQAVIALWIWAQPPHHSPTQEHDGAQRAENIRTFRNARSVEIASAAHSAVLLRLLFVESAFMVRKKPRQGLKNESGNRSQSKAFKPTLT